MVFSTRFCRSLNLLSALLALWLLGTALLWDASAHAQGIELRKATTTITEDAYLIDAQFDIALTHTLEEVLSKGVALYFMLDFELIRPRWYWFNDRVVALHQQYRLQYNALTRQYRLGLGNLYQNFPTLGEALDVMSRVSRRQEVEAGLLRRDASYIAAIRMRLDTSQLPKPFQLSALASRDWQLNSDWHRWAVNP
ncbi:MAG TPA: DUF4390 domain-containing protein [Burkholderiales bacterium]|nr:DUF4390 domain-containing protein [Burkholderiales bacterium]